MHKMQEIGVTAIENMKRDKKENKIRDTILLNLRAKSISKPIPGEIRAIDNMIKSSGYSLKSSPSIKTVT